LVVPKHSLKHIHRTPKAAKPRVGHVLRMGRNERTIPFSDAIVHDMLAGISGEDIVAYPEIEPLYTQLGRWLAVERDQLLLFNGSEAGIKALFEVYVEVGDDVICLHPAFHGYTVCGRIYGARMQRLGYTNTLDYDRTQLLAAIAPSTKLVLLGNPDAVGSALDLDYLRLLLQKAATVGALVIVDEAYHHFGACTAVDLIDQYDNILVLRSFSKAFGAAGVRIGLAVAAPGVIHDLNKVKLNYDISAIAVKIGQYLVQHLEIMESYVADVRHARALLSEHLGQLGLYVHPSIANFVLVRLPNQIDVADYLAYVMAEARLELTGGFDPPLEHYVRITVGPWEQLQQVVEVTRHFLAGHATRY
jgi:histidinol-phosphate aminotransferase